MNFDIFQHDKSDAVECDVRIRNQFHVSSSCFPHFDPNMNTGNKFGTDGTGIIAEQTVYRDAEYPSYIILPVQK